MSYRANPVRIQTTSTSTGVVTGTADFGVGMGSVSATHVIVGTTKDYTFALQGSIADSGVWQNLTAATTGSTSGAVKSSTVAMTFDKVRVNLSANGTTGNGTITFYLLARP